MTHDEHPEAFRLPNLDGWYQFTGLKDKNGKEIYEGDIIKGYKGDVGAVEYDAPSFSLPFGYEETQHIEMTEGEVIGNIYENPELLKS